MIYFQLNESEAECGSGVVGDSASGVLDSSSHTHPHITNLYINALTPSASENNSAIMPGDVTSDHCTATELRLDSVSAIITARQMSSRSGALSKGVTFNDSRDHIALTLDDDEDEDEDDERDDDRRSSSTPIGGKMNNNGSVYNQHQQSSNNNNNNNDCSSNNSSAVVLDMFLDAETDNDCPKQQLLHQANVKDSSVCDEQQSHGSTISISKNLLTTTQSSQFPLVHNLMLGTLSKEYKNSSFPKNLYSSCSGVRRAVSMEDKASKSSTKRVRSESFPKLSD